ncbi:hypothetical protein CL616_03115 [archaeon]|nr:hypothetical protein [archaeon]|tara:strand:+ start:255 stop:521 length:267 start_codon:yes stop_codon:yes gene_type:complete
MIKIFAYLAWKGKKLRLTKHFALEFDNLNKPLEFVLDILKNGEHYLINKKEQKFKVYLPYKKKYLCLVYVIDQDNLILIHIKPKRSKK